MSVKMRSADARVYYSWLPKNSSFVALTKQLPNDSIWVRADEPIKETFKYKGQAQQDRICLETFNDMKGGYYVDLAAHNWKLGSNTWNLDTYNDWRGICIEANPSDLLGLLAYRKCHVYVNPVGAITGEKLKFVRSSLRDSRAVGLSPLTVHLSFETELSLPLALKEGRCFRGTCWQGF
jgi:hypothetical protein